MGNKLDCGCPACDLCGGGCWGGEGMFRARYDVSGGCDLKHETRVICDDCCGEDSSMASVGLDWRGHGILRSDEPLPCPKVDA